MDFSVHVPTVQPISGNVSSNVTRYKLGDTILALKNRVTAGFRPGSVTRLLDSVAKMCPNCQDVQRLGLVVGPVSFSFCFSGLVIHNTPPTDDIVTVAFTSILWTFLSTSFSQRQTGFPKTDVISFGILLADTVKTVYLTPRLQSLTGVATVTARGQEA